MKQSSSELKRIAKGKLLGHYLIPISALGIIIMITIIFGLLERYILITGGTNAVAWITYFGIALIFSIFMMILSAGNLKISLDIARGKDAKVNHLLYGFKHNPDRLILMLLLLSLYLFLCTLPLLIFIGLSKVLGDSVVLALVLVLVEIGSIGAVCRVVLTYSQITYIYLEHPEKKVIDIFRESKRLMKGNKGRLFYLYISFTGLMLLSLLTCYIGLLWLYPYMNTTTALFYLELNNELLPADAEESTQNFNLGNTFM